MKRAFVIAIIVSLICVPAAFAGNVQGQLQGQKQGQKQGQQQGQAQIGINANKGNTGNSTTNVNQDEDVEVWAPTWAPTPSTAGKEEGKVYTIFGGVDSNEPSRDVRVDHQIKTLKLLLDEEIIDRDIYEEEMIAIYDRLKQQNSSKRVLGLLWKTEGRHIGNLFGLAAIDDLRGKLHRPTGDDDIGDGNEGNVN